MMICIVFQMARCAHRPQVFLAAVGGIVIEMRDGQAPPDGMPLDFQIRDARSVDECPNRLTSFSAEFTALLAGPAGLLSNG